MEKINNSLQKKTVVDLVANVNEISRIAEGSVLKGDLSSINDIRIDGNVEGTVYSKGLIVVGESAKVTGAILCSKTEFQGELQGDLYVSDMLNLKSTAKVTGNIRVNQFQVEIGAQLNGTCKMITKDEFAKDCEAVVKVKCSKSSAAEDSKSGK